ncbi:MAG: AraC family transcriptional regulator, partial [Bacteroidota bacterium]
MKITTLPEDLFDADSEDIIVYDYQALKESSKQQVNLSMNTFSFLLEGHKQVFSDAKSTAITNSEFLLMKAGKCLMTETFNESNNLYRSILFFFSNEAVFHFIRKYSINLSKEAQRKTIQNIPFDHFLRSFAESLIDVNKLSDHNRGKVLQVKFEELMLYLIDKLG